MIVDTIKTIFSSINWTAFWFGAFLAQVILHRIAVRKYQRLLIAYDVVWRS